MRKSKFLTLIAAITLTIGAFCASGFIMEEAKLLSIPFYVCSGVLAYGSYAIWRWGKQPTEKELKETDLRKAIRNMPDEMRQQKAQSLFDKVGQIERIYKKNDDFILASNNIQALHMFLESYIELANNQHSVNEGADLSDSELTNNINILQYELQAKKDTGNDEEVRIAKEATLEVLRKRRQASLKRKAINAKVEMEMHRIEAQFDLALESAALKPVEISATIKVASDILMTPGFNEYLTATHGVNDPPKMDDPLRDFQ